MSMIQRQIKELREKADMFRQTRLKWPEIANVLDNAADTIEQLSEKLKNANLKEN